MGQRFALSWLVGLSWFALGLIWIWPLSPPGYVVAVALEALGPAIVGLATVQTGRRIMFPAAVVAMEFLRGRVPFGGMPVASVALGQVAGPLARVVPVIGALGLGAMTALSAEILAARSGRIRGLFGVTALIALTTLAPNGHRIGSWRVAAVQGGGPQATHLATATRGEARRVFQRHLDTSLTIKPGSVDLVVWPENTASVYGKFTESRQEQLLLELAARLDAPVTAGIVEDTTRRPGDEVGRFRNAQMVFEPDGTIADRYDKVRRVPFGEYMPGRSLLDALGLPVNLVPKDAIAGSGPPIVHISGRTVGVMISWEVFFADSARDAVDHGAEFLINPTNGSSYTGTFLQTQQVAVSRLRAQETGRFVVQAAPTGFSAVIAPDGRVIERSTISESRVLIGAIERRAGRTWFDRLGERNLAALAAVAFGAEWLRTRTRRRDP
jgi:apolipoprotein N-acyltransferase